MRNVAQRVARYASRCAAGLAVLAVTSTAAAEVALRVYVGGQQRPDIMRELFAEYMACLLYTSDAADE